MDAVGNQIIRDDLEEISIETPSTNIIVDLFYSVIYWIKTAVLGLAFALMLSCYAVIFIFLLNQIGAPLPYEVSETLSNIEYHLREKAYEMKSGSTSWRVISDGRGYHS